MKKDRAANAIRDRAMKHCTDHAAARAAWDRVRADPRCRGMTARAARLAILDALAKGKTISEAEKAGWAVLA
jgi:hypothetical protein